VERDEQLAELIAATRAGRVALVEGPYRHGKTSLLNAALAELTAEEGTIGVDIDCSGVLTANDFVRRLELGYRSAQSSGAAKELLTERVDALSLIGVPYGFESR
jgi:ABC-type cobalamin transport system ATPase subunit